MFVSVGVEYVESVWELKCVKRTGKKGGGEEVGFLGGSGGPEFHGQKLFRV